MIKFFLLIVAYLAAFSSTLTAASNTFLDYQNYNHGYCPDCNCCPCKCAGGNCHAQGNPHATPPEEDPVNPQGACKKPDPCCPPATSTCTECGINILYVGAAVIIIAAASRIIVGTNNGSVKAHSAP